MKPILSREGLVELDAFARDRGLVVFDFDGTLAPIVARRGDAALAPETRTLLRATSLLYPCAVVSGRARSDVAARLLGIPLVAIVGNHGAEAGYGPLDKARRDTVARWRQHIEEAIPVDAGIDLEDKHFSLAVHYRHARSRTAAHRRILAAAAELDGARVFDGHAVVNVVPSDAPHKGDAVEEIRRRIGLRRTLYVGDDRTDEDAFRDPRVGIGIRVGRTARSAAKYYVPSQPRVDDLLRALLATRTRIDGVGVRIEGMTRALAR